MAGVAGGSLGGTKEGERREGEGEDEGEGEGGKGGWMVFGSY
jgi:hypothetical protein